MYLAYTLGIVIVTKTKKNEIVIAVNNICDSLVWLKCRYIVSETVPLYIV